MSAVFCGLDVHKESTYIIPMYRKLVEEGYDVTVSHPKKTRYIAEARIKSDRVDSKALAELLRLDSLPESYWPPPEIALLREKVRRRAFLVRQNSKPKVKIRGCVGLRGDKATGETRSVHHEGSSLAEQPWTGASGLLSVAHSALEY